MLAEPRRREKYSVNPRGLEWTNDDSKIGQKLLEKMGWKKGNSLGLRENGISQPIKVMAKSSRQGVGCTKKDVNNWIAHQDDFSSILASLNEDASQPNCDSSNSSNFFSLEEKSKVSRSRVHYKKFAKGKDLSTYEAADLQSIFGQRQKRDASDTEEGPSQDNESESANGASASFGVVTINSTTSMQNYFAQKMADMKLKLAKGTNSGSVANNAQLLVETSLDDNEIPRRQCKRKKSSDIVDSAENNYPVNGNVTVSKCKKGKRDRKSITETDIIDSPNEQNLCDPEHVRKRKKNKRDKTDKHAGNIVDLNTATASLENGDDLQPDFSSAEVPCKKRKTKLIKTLDKNLVERDSNPDHRLSAPRSNSSKDVRHAADMDTHDGNVSKSKKSKKKKRCKSETH